MKETIANSLYFGVLLTLITYIIGLKVNRRFKKSIFNPILISVVSIILILLISDIDYDSYNKGGQLITFLLTPATICLAIPLYQQIDILKKNFKVIVLSILVGSISSLISILLFAMIFDLSEMITISMLPKSITTAIAVGVTEELGGVQAITILSIMITGIFGNIICESVCKLFKIKNPISKGLAIGTSAHAVGTSKALEIGEVEGAMSGLAIPIAGILTVILAPIFVNLV